MIRSSSRDLRATVDVEIPGRPVAVPLIVNYSSRSLLLSKAVTWVTSP